MTRTPVLLRLIGMSRALDLILTGRPVHADEALAMGLANRVVGKGDARKAAEELAAQIAGFPWNCVLSDRKSAYEGASLPFDQAMAHEFELGLATVESGETLQGASRFAGGAGRHGKFK